MRKNDVETLPECNRSEIRGSTDVFLGNPRNTVSKPKLLLHSCCGPCSSAVIERLCPEYDITVFYYNPCITDPEEYEKRKETQIQLINAMNLSLCTGGTPIEIWEGEYDPEAFLERVKGLEEEPEGGKRCTACFALRLEKTAAAAASSGFPIFATTLTVSPHKDYRLITEIGKKCAEKYGIEYLDHDFKKKAGFQRSVQLSREYGLYRQNYCGCLYSKNVR